MKHARAGTRWPLIAIALSVTTACASPPQAMTDAEAKTVRDAVTALDDSVNTAVDRLDCAAAFKSVADREPMFVSNAMVIRTRPVFEAACKGMVAPRTGAVFTVDTLTAQALAPNAGYVVREGKYTINFKDGTSTAQHMVITTVWEKRDQAWRMVHLHESYTPLAPTK